jgi:prepilin-type N-terminal cleavage/methylation domain-containing protein
MRRKSGFSLVELTIVLIIVGIIIAMFMGGISFMEKARIKTELGKLTKFSSAMTTYYAQNGAVPPDLDTAIWGASPNGSIKFFEPTAFEDFGLTKEDFKSNYQKNRNDLSYLISSCWLFVDNSTPNDPRYKYTNGPLGSSTSPTESSHSVCIYFNNFMGRFICNLEKSVDDKRIDKGDALIWDPATAGSFGFPSSGVLDDNISCDSDTIGENSNIYGYKVFQY